MPATRPMISSGWNNISGLKRLHKIDTNGIMLQVYKAVDPTSVWSTTDEWIESSNRRLYPQSLPFVTWTLPYITIKEHRLFISSFATSGSKRGKVTVNVYDSDRGDWYEMNGYADFDDTSRFGENQRTLDVEGYVITIRGLRDAT